VAQASACDLLAYIEPSILLSYIHQPFLYRVVLDVLNLFFQLVFKAAAVMPVPDSSLGLSQLDIINYQKSPAEAGATCFPRMYLAER
jgi:hypothetical protein